MMNAQCVCRLQKWDILALEITDTSEAKALVDLALL